MIRTVVVVVVAAVLGGAVSVACKPRIEEESEIDTLCAEWCTRYVECGAVVYPREDDTDVEGCTNECASNSSLTKCREEVATMLRCEAGPGMECPAFQSFIELDGPCFPQRNDVTLCNSRGGE